MKICAKRLAAIDSKAFEKRFLEVNARKEITS
jgi:hypothetical protein